MGKIHFWNGQGHGQGLRLKRSFVVVGKDSGEAVKEDPQVGRVEGQAWSEPGNHESFLWSIYVICCYAET